MPRRADTAVEGAELLALIQDKWPEVTVTTAPDGKLLVTCPEFDIIRRNKGGRRGRPSDRDDYFHNGDLRCLKAALEWVKGPEGYRISGLPTPPAVRPTFTGPQRARMRKYQNVDDKGRDRNTPGTPRGRN